MLGTFGKKVILATPSLNGLTKTIAVAKIDATNTRVKISSPAIRPVGKNGVN